ncbi:sensor histidine kinase [Krasilnikovia sp. M28-CT-15]|uniref:sensor histidine kinase n=1 Tax=Krasilnikovia sp. M28-CT-15 TaxID=3373540 RepID=UPI00399D1F0D
MARELGLGVLLAAIIWGSARLSSDPAWTFIECAPESPLIWVPMGGAVVLGLLGRKYPSVSLVGAAGLFGVWPVSGCLLALAAFRAAAETRPTRRLTAFGLAVLADFGAAFASAQYGWSIVAVGHAVALIVCLGLPVGVQLLLGKADRLVGALRERAHYLEENYRLAHSAARLQERSRIAQEMHDELGHRLSLIALHAGALELATAQQAPAGADQARLIRSTVQSAMRELRTSLGILRAAEPVQAQLQPVQETGTQADLARLVDESRSAGVPVDLTWHGDDLRGVALPVRQAAHRLVRESLTNIHRHAPGAVATVQIDRSGDRIRILIGNGRPSTPAPAVRSTRHGLVGVQERVRLLNGDFAAGPTTDGGFQVRAELPLTDVPVTGGPEETLPTGNSGRTAPPFLGPRHARGGLRRLRDARGVAAVLAAGLLGVPALVSVVLDAASILVPGADPYDSPEEPVRIGMTQADVMSAIGEDDPVARLAAKGIETRPPAGAACVYAQQWDDVERILRYCFQGDRLVVMDEFPITTGS